MATGTIVIPVMGNTTASDLNSFSAGSLQIFLYNNNTLHSPYKEGLTVATAGIVFSYASSSNNAVQICGVSGGSLYVRQKAGGTWQPWKMVSLI